MLHEKFLAALNFFGMTMPDGEITKQINSLNFVKVFKKAYELYLLKKYGSMQTFGNSFMATDNRDQTNGKYGMVVFQDKENYIVKLWVGKEELNFSNTNCLRKNTKWITINGSLQKPNEIQVDSANGCFELPLSPFVFERETPTYPLVHKDLYIFFELYEKVMNEITNTVLFVN